MGRKPQTKPWREAHEPHARDPSGGNPAREHTGRAAHVASRQHQTDASAGAALILKAGGRDIGRSRIRTLWPVRSRYEITCPFFEISLRLLMPVPRFLRSSYSLTTA